MPSMGRSRDSRIPSAVLGLLLAAGGATPAAAQAPEPTRITWTSIGPQDISGPVYALAGHPTSTATVDVGTGLAFVSYIELKGAGILKSTDGGETRTRLESTNTAAFPAVTARAIDSLCTPVKNW